MSEFDSMFDDAARAMVGSPSIDKFSERHGIHAAPYLTVTSDEVASLLAERLAPRIAGKIVVEVGGGIGLLAMHLGQYAAHVFCIEANPVWSSVFVHLLLQAKPKNVSFLFGAADEFAGAIRGDVALFCTHSDVTGMGVVAGQFAPVVIDIYGELIAEAPDQLDPLAVALRAMT